MDTNAAMADFGIACERTAGVLVRGSPGWIRQGRAGQRPAAKALPPSQGGRTAMPSGCGGGLQGWQKAGQGPSLPRLKCQLIDWCYRAAVNI